MSNIDLAKRFYSLPRITPEDRAELIKMFHEDVEYHGVGKQRAYGRDALGKLFARQKAEGTGITDITFEIKHIVENGNTVLIDMVDTLTINGKIFSGVWSIVFEFDNNGQITYWQEHYPLEKIESLYNGVNS